MMPCPVCAGRMVYSGRRPIGPDVEDVLESRRQQGCGDRQRRPFDHAGIVAALDPLFAAYAGRRQAGERFGAFAIRAGFIAPTRNGPDFHANTGPQRAA